jgi:hypothetical protein
LRNQNKDWVPDKRLALSEMTIKKGADDKKSPASLPGFYRLGEGRRKP